MNGYLWPKAGGRERKLTRIAFGAPPASKTMARFVEPVILILQRKNKTNKKTRLARVFLFD
jgi:hypothetical protein